MPACQPAGEPILRMVRCLNGEEPRVSTSPGGRLDSGEPRPPARPGPVGKALAVGLVTLAVRAGLSWLGRRTTAEHRSSTLTTRELDAAVPKRLLGQSLEEILIQELEVEHRGRALAWRAVRSIIITEPIDRRS